MSTPAVDTSPRVPSGLHLVRGLPLALIFKKEIIEEICDFMPEEGDILIATYPKTGTYWMQYTVLQILSRGEFFPTSFDEMENIVPFLEFTGMSITKQQTQKPRVYKHHLPYNMVRKNPKSKVIYVYRRPDDTFVSYYHFIKNINGEARFLDFDQFFEDYVNGNKSYGRYFEHILSFLEHKDDGNILFVSYEKLLNSRKEEVLKVAKFLGDTYYNDLIENEAILNNILEKTSFNYMKGNIKATVESIPQEGFDKNDPLKNAKKKEINFFRKGTIGDGKNHLTVSQLMRVKEVAKEAMKGTNILMEWYPE